jgi:hypothetical protein
MENNKINKLFDSARNADPVVSFDEAIDALNKKVESKDAVSGWSAWTTFLVVASSVLLVVGGFYLTLFKSEKQATNEVVNQNTTIQQEMDKAMPDATPSVNSGNNTVAPSEIINDHPELKKEPAVAIASETPAPIKNKITHAVTPNDDYVIETQTVNINDDQGQFKVYFNGDNVSHISLNGVNLDQEDWPNYQSVIDEALNVKNIMGVNHESAENKKFVEFLFSTLKDKGLIQNNLAVVKLNKDVLLIEGQPCDTATHHLMIEQYQQITGKGIGNRTLYFN